MDSPPRFHRRYVQPSVHDVHGDAATAYLPRVSFHERYDADPYRMRVRADVVARLVAMNVGHVQAAWDHRRTTPIAAYAVAFVYLNPQPQGPDTNGGRHAQAPPDVVAATRLFHDGDADDLAVLLRRLAVLARERYGSDFDPRQVMADRIDADMRPAAEFLGVGVSSLDTADRTWAEQLDAATRVFDIGGRCLALMRDGGAMVIDRSPERGLGEVTVHANVAVHHSRWRSTNNTTLTAMTGDPVWEQLRDLHDLAATAHAYRSQPGGRP